MSGVYLFRQLPLSFLPLDSIAAKPLRENLRRLGGSARLAIDVLNFDRRYEKGFLFVCGNAVVCDTLEEAKYLAYQQQVAPSSDSCAFTPAAVQIGVKVVTLDGTMIHKMGYMTGGLSESMESKAATSAVLNKRSRFDCDVTS